MSKRQPTASTSKRTLSATPSLSSVASSQFGSSQWDSDTEYVGQEPYRPPQFNRFPLRVYLKYSALPLFKHVSHPSISSLIRLAYAPEWPKFRQLSRPVGKPGRRVLTQVNRLTSDEVLAGQVKRCFSSIEPIVMGRTQALEDEFAPYMHLPCMDIVNFDEEDQRLLSNVRHEDDVYRVMQRYVLDTASNCLRIMYGCEYNSAFTNKVRFSIANRLLPAHHGCWDIFILPDDGKNKVPLVLIFVPPWEFGYENFNELVAPREFKNDIINTLDSQPYSSANALLAIAYDVLKGRGYKFIFTNYTRWAFGAFTSDYQRAGITNVYEADLVDLDGFTDFSFGPNGRSPALDRGASVLEMLVLWMQLALGLYAPARRPEAEYYDL
ncbi:hypothetical protein M413DRAFT_443483 [Hebeloma cylindrosporum]|uniref:Uncharacterized protein n=1 Tax=Hebeloma cylindrosporum TaxID=76867 RepID=A0A0C3C3U8_HEBCY|nr:hypothetical protein M413DRAFT_443483 [Hebeloma cylindrosporum h7]